MKALITLTLLAALTGCSREERGQAPSPVPAASAASAATAPRLTNSERILRRQMYRLMTQHVIWTRSYLKAVITETPDAQAAYDRLMQNQSSLASFLGQFYAPEVTPALQALLSENIKIQAEVIANIKSADNSRYNEINSRWQTNATAIADYLSGLNPNWDKTVLREVWLKYLSTTTAETVARFQQDWGADVQAVDQTYEHMLAMGDLYSDGLIAQFPEKFR